MSLINRFFYQKTLRNVTATHAALMRDCTWFVELPPKDQWKMAHDFSRARKDNLQEWRILAIALAAISAIFYKLFV